MDRSSNCLVTARPTVKNQRAIWRNRNHSVVGQGRISLNRNRIVSRSRVRPFADNGIAYKPIKLDRLPEGVDNPSDQIATGARSRRNADAGGWLRAAFRVEPN